MENIHEYLEAIGKALEENEFCEVVYSADSKESVIAEFKKKGINVSEETAQGILEKVAEINSNNGELSPEDLDMIAGGKINFGRIASSGMAAIVTVAGFSVGGPAGAAIGAAIGCQLMYKEAKSQTKRKY